MTPSLPPNAAQRSLSTCNTLAPFFEKPHRCASLWMCVSTGRAGSFPDMARTTLAVFLPTPGSDSSSSLETSSGRSLFLPYRATNIADVAATFLAFVGARPRKRMCSSMPLAPRAASAAAVGASLKRVLVASLTLTSVVCAESITATKS